MRVFEKPDNDVIFPIMQILGNDERFEKEHGKESVHSMGKSSKTERDNRLYTIEETDENHLYNAVQTEVIETAEGQLSPF